MKRNVGITDPTSDFSPPVLTSQWKCVPAVILRWRGSLRNLEPWLLGLTSYALLKGSGFWHLLWTKVDSLHPALPNRTIRKQFHFLYPRDWTNGNDSQAINQLVTIETFTKTFEWFETWCCESGGANYSSTFLLGFSLMWLALYLRLTILF